MCTSISTCRNDRRSCLSNGIYNIDIKLILRVNLLISNFTILSLLLIACIESIRVIETCMLCSREVIVRVSNYTLIQTILRSTCCTTRSNSACTCRSLWSRDRKTYRSLLHAILELDVCFICKVYVCWVYSIVNRTCNALNVPLANYQSLIVCTSSTLIREYNVSISSSIYPCKLLTRKSCLVYIREHLSLNNLQLLILKDKTCDKVIEVFCKNIKIGINVLNIHVYQILNSVCIILYSTILKSLDSLCIILYSTILKSLYSCLIITLKLSKLIIDDILDSSLIILDKLLQFIILIAKSLVSLVVRFLKRLKSLIDGYDISTILFNILLCSLKILLSTLELLFKSLIGSLKILGCGLQVLNKLLDILLVSFSKFLNLFSKSISLISLSLSSLQVTIFKVSNSLFNKSL